jgi:hypothetical protein
VTRRLGTICFMTMILIGVSSPSVAPSPQVMSNTVEEKAKVFFGYMQDYLGMQVTYFDNDREFQIIANLREVAFAEFERLSNADDLLVVYSGTACQTDRTKFRALVTNRLSTASGYTDSALKSTQNGIDSTKMPGTAAIAVRMKEDLRDAKVKLDQARNILK